MDNILKMHFHPWTIREIICFFVILTLTVAIAIILLYNGKIIRRQAVAGILSVFCLGIIFASTVFTRLPESDRLYEHEFVLVMEGSFPAWE